MTRIRIPLLISGLLILAAGALAAPSPPTIILATSGLTATAAWDPVPGASGYTLYYAPMPYSGPASIGTIALGPETGYRAELWPGAAFYVAVTAYDGEGESGYSNVAAFTLADSVLRRAASATEFEAYLKNGLLQQGETATGYRTLVLDDAMGELAGAPVAAEAAATGRVSGTNLQVAGVDEADRVKSDGRSLFVIEQAPAYALPDAGGESIRVLSLHPETATAAELTRIPLPEALPLDGLYLLDGSGSDSDLLVTLGSNRETYLVYALDWFVPWSWQQRETEIHLIDVSTPSSPQIVRNYRFDGQLVASRRIGSQLYLVLRYNPTLPDYVLYPLTDQDRERNRALVASTPLDELVPHFRVDGSDRGSLVTYAQSFLPLTGSESATADLIVLLSLDLRDPAAEPVAVTLAGPTETLYMSTQALYLATTAYHYQPVTIGGARVAYDESMTTDLHKFALTDDGPVYRGSGSVAGHLGWEQDKKSFRMGDVGSALGIVTSTGNDWAGDAGSRLTILDESPTAPGMLVEIARLPNENRPDPLGKAGEKLYAARFLGKRLYLVTFRVTDPLYVINLADPGDPFIEGSLEIDGYSDYLHPVGDTLLLGIGKDAIPDAAAPPEGRGAWYQGVKLSLFDVADLAAPRELRSFVIGRRGTQSEVLTDHHALAYLEYGQGSAVSARLAIPVEVHDSAGSPYDTTAPWYYYDWTQTGLYLFDLTGLETAAPDLQPAGSLIVDRAPPGDDPWYATGERAVIVDDSIYYLHRNGVWSAPWENPERLKGPQ